MFSQAFLAAVAVYLILNIGSFMNLPYRASQALINTPELYTLSKTLIATGDKDKTGWKHLIDCLTKLPAVSHFLLEYHLGKDRIDYAVPIETPVSLMRHAIQSDDPLDCLAEQWKINSCFASYISAIWLEYDCPSQSLYPSVFLDLDRFDSLALSTLLSTLHKALIHASIAQEISNRLISLYHQISEFAFIKHIGIMYSRSEKTVRVSLTVFHLDYLYQLLEICDITISAAVLSKLKTIWPLSDYFVVGIELNKDNIHCSGIECHVSRSEDQEKYWERFTQKVSQINSISPSITNYLRIWEPIQCKHMLAQWNHLKFNWHAEELSVKAYLTLAV